MLIRRSLSYVRIGKWLSSGIVARVLFTAAVVSVSILLHLFVPCAAAQETESSEADDSVTVPYWESELLVKLRGAQASYHNWTEGGVNSLSGAGQLSGTFKRISANWLQTYDGRLAIGVVKQDTLDIRKAEDVIRLQGQVSYRGNGFFRAFNPTFAAGLRTQFAPGFNYDKNPFDDGRSPPVKVSDILAPATFTQSLGLSYSSNWGFKQRFGVGAKETVVALHYYRPIYGLRPSQAVRFQLGVESHTELDREIFKNVMYKSSLGLFAAFNQEELPDMLWENLLIMKVNSWLSADIEFVALYDRDLSNAVQIKEAFSIGVSVAII